MLKTPLLILTLISIGSWSCQKPKRRSIDDVNRPSPRVEVTEKEEKKKETETGLESGAPTGAGPEVDTNNPTDDNPSSDTPAIGNPTSGDPTPVDSDTIVEEYNGSVLKVTSGVNSLSTITFEGSDARKLFINMEVLAVSISTPTTDYHTVKNSDGLSCERYHLAGQPGGSALSRCTMTIESKSGTKLTVEPNPTYADARETISSIYSGTNLILIKSSFETAGIIRFSGADAMIGFQNLEIDTDRGGNRKVGSNLLCEKALFNSTMEWECKAYIDFKTGEVLDMN